MRVLVVDEWLPLPLDSGKKIRTYHLLAPLARRHEITYLCFADPEAEAEKVSQMERAGFCIVCVPPARRFQTPATLAVGLATNLFLRAPLVIRKHYSRRFQQAAERLLARERFDLVHCEWTHYAQYLQSARGLPRFLSSHNVESMQWRRFARVQTNPFRKAAIHVEWLKMQRFEHRVIRDFDHVAVVSDEDAHTMRAFGTPSVDVIPNGVDTKYYQESDGRERPGLGVLHSMDAFVNQDAAVYFAKRVFPRICARKPQARFMIIGRCPPKSIQNLAGDRITVTGSVEDVRPLLSKTMISVVPLRIAGGSRLKILESFAAGIPVVSTSIGAEGLDIEPGRHLIVADDESAFAAECLRLMEQPQLRAQLAAAARSCLKDKYDWSVLSPLVEGAWETTSRRFMERSSKEELTP